MAEKAAHHTTTVVTCPSIFEVIAQESLSATIYPALKKLVDYINLKNSNKCIWLVQYFDEVYLIFNTLCQLYYLKTYGGTFSENFYDLTRVRQPSNLRSAQKQLLFNLALTVCVPYLRIKLETYITNSKTKHNTQLLDKYIIILNKIVYTTWELLCLIYYLKYLTGISQTHSPLFDVAGIKLTYKNNASRKNDTIHQLSIRECIKSYLHYGISHSLELSAFFLQFLNWWHSENLQSKFIAYPIPYPPKINEKYISVNKSSNCPICMNEKKMPTALRVSGFVFCYKCLHKSLMMDSRCPVTKLPATMQDMIRVYSENN